MKLRRASSLLFAAKGSIKKRKLALTKHLIQRAKIPLNLTIYTHKFTQVPRIARKTNTNARENRKFVTEFKNEKRGKNGPTRKNKIEQKERKKNQNRRRCVTYVTKTQFINCTIANDTKETFQVIFHRKNMR